MDAGRYRVSQGTSASYLAPQGTGLGCAERLDLHGGLSERAADEGRTRAAGCERASKAVWLYGSGGRLVRGRCRATNQCDYCARLGAVEWAEMLALDACEGEAPEVWAVLTTRSASVDPADFYGARRAVMDALRARWPDVRYLAVCEFTTGYGPRSGGKRRPHWNLLLKGVPRTDVDAARAVIVTTWCAQADAVADGQYVDTIVHEGGLMRYLALHFQKETQRPPKSWRGKQRVTFSTTRNRAGGYFNRPVWKVRKAAQDALRFKRELWRAESAGYAGREANAIAELATLRAAGVRWEAVVPTIDKQTGELLRVRPLHGGEGRVLRVDRTRTLPERQAQDIVYVLTLDTLDAERVYWRDERPQQLAMLGSEFRRRGP